MGYLRAAEHALYRGQTGMAQNALEMAETRLLDRSVVQGQGSTPDDSHAIQSIDVALNDLARHDIAGAEQATRNAMPRIWQGTDQGQRNWNPASASSGA